MELTCTYCREQRLYIKTINASNTLRNGPTHVVQEHVEVIIKSLRKWQTFLVADDMIRRVHCHSRLVSLEWTFVYFSRSKLGLECYREL